ncbi:MAG: mannose-1-phosphate guanylyltransferase/mannose-6-phosphate isomerase [Desulfobacterales bacterium]|nr:mannose-1-phosphate guanylyltransferase/mannose-6-phosphate isomerase [Desulfobacterales bacterium]
MIIPVILAGGSGTRLWPMSRELYPKQLLKLTGNHTMFQQTLLRVCGMDNVSEPLVICSKKHRHSIARQLRDVDVTGYDMVLEPVGRNTAPAVATAAIRVLSIDREARILILPADHLIEDEGAFRQAVKAADSYASEGYLITFGVVPDSPETGYGYIRKGQPLEESSGEASASAAYRIERFVEKPDQRTAEKYVSSGKYCWNSGMFMFRAADVYDELERFSPEILSACREACSRGSSDGRAFCLDEAAFDACPSESIDYAVMEKTGKGAMIPFSAGWSDVGSWTAMWEAGEKDMDGNVIAGEVMARHLKNSLVISEQRLAAVLGIESCVVIDTADALLVADMQRSQDVKSVVSALKAEKRREAFCHEIVYTSWGTVTEIESDEQCAIRRVCLLPSKRLEFVSPSDGRLHWTLISGAGTIKRNDSEVAAEKGVFLEIVGESSVEAKNTGQEPLVFIEVCMPGSSGQHLAEKDGLY